MSIKTKSQKNHYGFTIVEVVVATLIFSIFASGVMGALNSIRKSYSLSRQYNEMYAVLSACPEIDRALQYDALSSGTNCYPNNSFAVEESGQGTLNYRPELSVQETTSLGNEDPLRLIPDSKVVNISVDYLKSSDKPLQLKLLITRNGVGQL
jgi:prepilin-type N-terminal cleavage/methylation domain-containing protein